MNEIGIFERYKTVGEAFLDRKENNKGITFIESTGDTFLSYSEIQVKAFKFLGLFQNKGLKPGDELIFQIKSNQDFILAFHACILGGIIPVPITVSENGKYKIKVFNVWSILNNPYLLTTSNELALLEAFADKENLRGSITEIKNKTVLIDEIDNVAGGIIHRSQETDIAFIQFSSGSTSEPKGVVLTHRNLMTNIKAIINGGNLTHKDNLLNWMPLTHDMGLIGMHLTPITLGLNQYIMPPGLFVKHPISWLEKISLYKPTIIASPNFGFKHVMKFLRLHKSIHLDLSSVRLIFNGAEMISAKVCNQFLNTMSAFQLKKDSMFPVYGLAEASLAVTFPTPGSGIAEVYIDRTFINLGQRVKEVSWATDSTVTFVEVGTNIENCLLRIVDENNLPVDDRVIGLIQIKGANVTSGYYNNKHATEKAITTDNWLNTGDLGFFRDKRLVVTGRIKDVIYINGNSFFAHDIESVCEEITEIGTNKVAVCGIYNLLKQVEEIVCFVVYRKEIKQFWMLSQELRKHILKKVGVGVSHVIPIERMPVTTSGKIQRYKLKHDFENGSYNPILEDLYRLETEVTTYGIG